MNGCWLTPGTVILSVVFTTNVSLLIIIAPHTEFSVSVLLPSFKYKSSNTMGLKPLLARRSLSLGSLLQLSVEVYIYVCLKQSVALCLVYCFTGLAFKISSMRSLRVHPKSYYIISLRCWYRWLFISLRFFIHMDEKLIYPQSKIGFLSFISILDMLYS